MSRQNQLKNKLSSIINFAFKVGNKNFTKMHTNGPAFWSKKTEGSVGYGRISLKVAVNHLIENCYFKL